jgi:hypothetical protein
VRLSKERGTELAARNATLQEDKGRLKVRCVETPFFKC